MDMVKPLTENSAMTRLQDILRLGRQLSPQINSIILERNVGVTTCVKPGFPPKVANMSHLCISLPL